MYSSNISGTKQTNDAPTFETRFEESYSLSSETKLRIFTSGNTILFGAETPELTIAVLGSMRVDKVEGRSGFEGAPTVSPLGLPEALKGKSKEIIEKLLVFSEDHGAPIESLFFDAFMLDNLETFKNTSGSVEDRIKSTALHQMVESLGFTLAESGDLSTPWARYTKAKTPP